MKYDRTLSLDLMNAPMHLSLDDTQSDWTALLDRMLACLPSYATLCFALHPTPDDIANFGQRLGFDTGHVMVCIGSNDHKRIAQLLVQTMTYARGFKISLLARRYDAKTALDALLSIPNSSTIRAVFCDAQLSHTDALCALADGKSRLASIYNITRKRGRLSHWYARRKAPNIRGKQDDIVSQGLPYSLRAWVDLDAKPEQENAQINRILHFAPYTAISDLSCRERSFAQRDIPQRLMAPMRLQAKTFDEAAPILILTPSVAAS